MTIVESLLLAWYAPLVGLLLLVFVMGLVAGWKFIDRDRALSWVSAVVGTIGLLLVASPYWTW